MQTFRHQTELEKNKKILFWRDQQQQLKIFYGNYWNWERIADALSNLNFWNSFNLLKLDFSLIYNDLFDL